MKCSEWHVLTSDHTVLPATHMHVYQRTERAILPLVPSRSSSTHFARYSFPVPGSWLHTEVVCPSEDGHQSQYQPTDSLAAGNRNHDH